MDSLISALDMESAVFIFKPLELYDLYRQLYNGFLISLLNNLLFLVPFQENYKPDSKVYKLITTVMNTITKIAPELTDQALNMAYSLITGLSKRTAYIKAQKNDVIEPIEVDRYCAIFDSVLKTTQNSEWSNSSITGELSFYY